MAKRWDWIQIEHKAESHWKVSVRKWIGVAVVAALVIAFLVCAPELLSIVSRWVAD